MPSLRNLRITATFNRHQREYAHKLSTSMLAYLLAAANAIFTPRRTSGSGTAHPPALRSVTTERAGADARSEHGQLGRHAMGSPIGGDNFNSFPGEDAELAAAQADGVAEVPARQAAPDAWSQAFDYPGPSAPTGLLLGESQYPLPNPSEIVLTLVPNQPVADGTYGEPGGQMGFLTQELAAGQQIEQLPPIIPEAAPDEILQTTVRGCPVSMRASDFSLNATEIFLAAGVGVDRRKSHLEKLRRRGYPTPRKRPLWLPFTDGVFLCQAVGLAEELVPLLLRARLALPDREENYFLRRYPARRRKRKVSRNLPAAPPEGFELLSWADRKVAYKPLDQAVNATQLSSVGGISQSRLSLYMRSNPAITKEFLVGNTLVQGTYIFCPGAITMPTATPSEADGGHMVIKWNSPIHGRQPSRAKSLFMEAARGRDQIRMAPSGQAIERQNLSFQQLPATTLLPIRRLLSKLSTERWEGGAWHGSRHLLIGRGHTSVRPLRLLLDPKTDARRVEKRARGKYKVAKAKVDQQQCRVDWVLSEIEKINEEPKAAACEGSSGKTGSSKKRRPEDTDGLQDVVELRLGKRRRMGKTDEDTTDKDKTDEIEEVKEKEGGRYERRPRQRLASLRGAGGLGCHRRHHHHHHPHHHIYLVLASSSAAQTHDNTSQSSSSSSTGTAWRADKNTAAADQWESGDHFNFNRFKTTRGGQTAQRWATRDCGEHVLV
ncbi:hypothetical protein VTK26DRAFT_7611 [Humicola hyalothermophila]